MNPFTKHAGSLQSTEAFLDRTVEGCPTVNWNGQDRRIVPGSALRKRDLSAGGFHLDADLLFEALFADFSDGLTTDQLKTRLLQTPLTYLSDTYKAVSVKIRPGGLQIRVEANSLAQKA